MGQKGGGKKLTGIHRLLPRISSLGGEWKNGFGFLIQEVMSSNGEFVVQRTRYL